MKIFALAIAVVQALLAVGLLALLQAVVRAFRPEWDLPFNMWWGLLTCLPGLGFMWLIRREQF